jgi:hypothetical protein
MIAWSNLLNVRSVRTYDKNNQEWIYVCTSSATQNLQTSINITLYTFNILIILGSVLFSYLNRHLSQELTDSSEILLMFINLYAFLIRLPLFLDPSELPKNIEFYYVTFIGPMAITSMLAICGSIGITAYYEVKGSYFVDQVLHKIRKEFSKTKSKVKKTLVRNMSGYSISSRQQHSAMDDDKSPKNKSSRIDVLNIDEGLMMTGIGRGKTGMMRLGFFPVLIHTSLKNGIQLTLFKSWRMVDFIYYDEEGGRRVFILQGEESLNGLTSTCFTFSARKRDIQYASCGSFVQITIPKVGIFVDVINLELSNEDQAQSIKKYLL